MPSGIGSHWTITIAPAALAGPTSASRSSTAPRKFGYCRKTAQTSSESAAASAAASVTPSASGISSIAVAQPALVAASASREWGWRPREMRKRPRRLAW
jgi:hypothetical protein